MYVLYNFVLQYSTLDDTGKMSVTYVHPTQMTTCRMTFNSDSWTETLTWDSLHLQKSNNLKQQMYLLCQPQSMNSCTCAQEGQQHQCDPCLLLASQVSCQSAGNTARVKPRVKVEENVNTHISLVRKMYRTWC